MSRKLPLPPHGSASIPETTAPWPSPPFTPPAVERQAPTLHEVVAPYLLPPGDEDEPCLQIQVLPDGTVEDARQLRDRHAAERRSSVDYADSGSAARSAGRVSLDLAESAELVLGWSAERVPIQSSATKLATWEQSCLSALRDHNHNFKRRCFLQIQRMQAEHGRYAEWWITLITVTRIA